MSIDQTDPFAPCEFVARAMIGYSPNRWWFAGGWAIDLYLGRATREHSDLEIGLFRRDQHALRRHLHRNAWEIQRCADRQWLAWDEGYTIALPDFQLQATHPTIHPREFDIFLDDLDETGDRWICRRHPSITLPRQEFTLSLDLAGGRRVRVLRPEIQLFYKAKYHRPKDESDFNALLPSLTAAARTWLSNAMAECYGNDPWRERL